MTRRCYVLMLLAMVVSAARADIVLYDVPRVSLVVTLQGKATVNPGRSISYRHPKFGKLTLGMESRETKIIKAPTTEALFARRLNRAKKPEECMNAARWALHHGLLQQTYVAAAKALQADPQFAAALRMKKLKGLIDQPLPDTGKEEQYIRRVVPFGRMRVAKSAHFILLHDTPDKPAKYHKQTRSEERLELLETVYESFLLKFYSQGVELQLPQERLMVVLFNDYEDYLDYATALSPSLSSASGFWDSDTNVAVFFDHGTHRSVKPLVELSEDLQRIKEKSLKDKDSRTKDIVRLANTLALIVEIERENLDIEVVSHECTHQMAGNTGLLPRHVMAPSWLHEGLATYFESPNDAAWSGIGAVNKERLKLYHELKNDRVHSNIDFIITDSIFDRAKSTGAKLHGYGQSWAITHFLMERHFDKLMTLYRRIGEMPPHVKLNPALLKTLFDEVFTKDRRTLDSQWRVYMNGLKTDLDRLLEEAGESP